MIRVLALLLACPASADDMPSGRAAQILFAEQNLISRQLDTKRILSPAENQQNPAYAPEAKNVFELESYWVPADQADAFSAETISPGIQDLFERKIGRRKYVRLIVHPESRQFYAKFLAESGAIPADSFLASSTSSSRTLMVWEKGKAENPFFAKLSLDASIGGVVRTVPASEMARSVGHTNVLDWERAHGNLPDGFSYLPETFSVMPKGMERGAMIIREMPPDSFRDSKYVVPLFSLYADPAGGKGIRLFRGSDPADPLLLQMLKKIEAKGEDPFRYVEDNLIRAFASQYVQLATHLGITMEAHAQNVLAGIGKDGLLDGTFLYRDFGGFTIDEAWRKKHGHDQDVLPFLRSVNRDYHQAEGKGFKNALPKTIETYFKGGFVYNLDQSMQKWYKQGLLKTKPPGKRYLESSVLGAIADEVAKAGVEVEKVPESSADLLAMLSKARNSYARSASDPDNCAARFSAASRRAGKEK